MTETFDFRRFDSFFKTRKLKAVQVANDMGISEATVSRYRKGKLPLEADFLRKFSKKYSCDIADFIAVPGEQRNKKGALELPDHDVIDWQKKYLSEVEETKKLLSERADLTARIDLLEKSDLAQNAKIWALEEFLLQLAAEVRKPGLEVTATDVETQSVILGKLEGVALRRSLNKNTAVSGSADKKGSAPGKVKAE